MSHLSAAKIQSVTDITRSIKGLLETGFSFVSVRGEVSNLRIPYSGHLYFTLKDHDAQIRAVLFKPQRRYLSGDINDGDDIICRGRITVYEPRGEYQLLVDTVEAAGAGERLAAFERLKETLRQEGLFREEGKKKLPLLPKGIALLTAPTGAAVHDFLTIARRRFPSVPIEIHPVPVQGPSAAPEIIRALNAACQRHSCDVIVICRGGGASEDLWAFNDEALARAVHRAPLPVISAIGHEVDFTILDFVADLRAPTPTAAAELVLPNQKQLRHRIEQLAQRQRSILTHHLAACRHRLEVQRRLLGTPAWAVDGMRLRLNFLLSTLQRSIKRQLAAQRQHVEVQGQTIARFSPRYLLARHTDRVRQLRQRLFELRQRQLERQAHRLAHCTTRLRALSPMAIMERGYAIVQTTPGGEVVRSRQALRPGQRLSIRWHDGRAECIVAPIGHKRE